MSYQKLFKPSGLALILVLAISSYFFVDFALAKLLLPYQCWLWPMSRPVYYLFNGAVVLPVVGILVLLTFIVKRLKSWQEWLIQLFCGLLLGQIVLALGKVLIGRARPYQALLQGYQSFAPLHMNNAFFSFPSGHTLNIMLIAGFLCLRFPEWTKWFLCLGFALGFFRVLGLDHFISDWLCTAYLAGCILILVRYCFENKHRFLHQKSKRG